MTTELISPKESRKKFKHKSQTKARVTPFNRQTETRRHGFLINDLGLLLPSNLTCEVADNLQVCKISNTPDWFTGMTNLRGNIIPIFDLGKLFGLSPSSNNRQADVKSQRHLFLEIGTEWVGFISNVLPTPLDLRNDEILTTFPRIPDELAPFVLNCYKHERVWIDFDLKKLLSWITSKF